MRNSTTRKVEFKNYQSALRYVFGLLFISLATFGGWFFLFAHQWSSDIEIQGDEWGFYLVFFLFGAVGLASLGGFRRVVVEGANRTASTQWGVFIPFVTEHYELSNTKTVSIDCEARTNGSDRHTSSYIVYVVRLEGVRNTKFNSNIKLKDGLDNLTLTELKDPFLARRDAERAAKLLALAVEDRTGETVLRREYEELDQSLFQRYRRDNVQVPSPAGRSTNSRVEVVNHGTKKEFRLPVTGRNLLPLFYAVAFLGGFHHFFNSNFDMVNEILGPYLGDHAQWKLLAALVCVALAWSLRRDVVTVDREAIEVDTRLPIVSWKARGTRRFLVSDLEEMNLDTEALILQSDVAWVRINTASLDSDDARFLHDSILYAIAR